MDQTNSSVIHTDKLLRFPEIHSITSLSRSTIWRMEREEKFPKRVKIGGRCVGWLQSEIKQWLSACPRHSIKSETKMPLLAKH